MGNYHTLAKVTWEKKAIKKGILEDPHLTRLNLENCYPNYFGGRERCLASLDSASSGHFPVKYSYIEEVRGQKTVVVGEGLIEREK